MSKKELQRKSLFDLVKLGQITQLDASKRLNLSSDKVRVSTVLGYLKEGASGLVHKSRGQVSPRAYSIEQGLRKTHYH